MCLKFFTWRRRKSTKSYRYISITDTIVSLHRVFHEMQMDMDMAVVITTVATVVGAGAHAVKVRIMASFLYSYFTYLNIIYFKWYIFQFYRPYIFSQSLIILIVYYFSCILWIENFTHSLSLCLYLLVSYHLLEYLFSLSFVSLISKLCMFVGMWEKE